MVCGTVDVELEVEVEVELGVEVEVDVGVVVGVGVVVCVGDVAAGGADVTELSSPAAEPTNPMTSVATWTKNLRLIGSSRPRRPWSFSHGSG